MTDTEFLQSEQLKISRKKAYKRKRVFFSTLTFVLAGLAIACMIGLLVAVILLNVKEDNGTLYLILTGSFAGGATVFAAAAFGLEKCSSAVSMKELDFRERCDSENSFFVGEGTLAVLNENELFIHAEDASNKTQIRVPYSEVRFFSVCNRRRPKDKGEWSVAIEIPAHYLAKAGKAKKGDPPALVQADGKERLYNRLKELGLELQGEQAYKNSGEKFTLLQKFKLPNRQKRNRAAMFLILGILLTVAGILLGIFVNSTLSVVSVLGLFIAGKALWSFLQAQAVFSVYREGIYFAESNRAQSTFLKWEEIVSVSREEKNSLSVLKVKCAYGDYHFPDVAGAYEAVTTAREQFQNEYGEKHERK